jgi:hypothetical protein
MRCCVFGVANHSPDDLVAALLKYRVASCASDIGILPPKEKADTSFKFLLVLSTSDLSRNFSRLHESGTKVFVFSNPIDLVDFAGIKNLDFRPIDDFSYTYTTLDLAIVSKSPMQHIERKPSPFLANLINSVKHGSLLNPLMTFIYSLASQNQNSVKTAVVYYLYTGQSESKLVSELSNCLTERAIEKLLTILSTSIGESYRQALGRIRSLRKSKTAFDIPKVAAETSTSAYELSYMLSVVDSMKKTSYSDSFDKAKNRKAIGSKIRSKAS